MVLNLRQVVSNWPGVTKVKNKDNPGDKEYDLVGTDDVTGAMWVGHQDRPVEVHYLGKLPDGRFASSVIMTIWDDGNYNLCWKFAAEATTYSQHIDNSRAFVLGLDHPSQDNIKLTTYAPENDSFDSSGKREAPNKDVSRKIAGAP